MAVLTALSLCSPAEAQNLRTPFRTLLPPSSIPKGEIFTCGTAPAPLPDLKIQSMYKDTDPTESIADPKLEAVYQKQIAPLNEYLVELARMANIYTRSNGRNLSAAKCALDWLHNWSSQDALLADGNRYGSFVRAWALSGLSASYIQIALDGRLEAAKKVEVKKWLSRLNKLVIHDYSSPAEIPKNNKLYWAAWAVGITSTVLQNPEHYKWAIEQAKTGLIQIEDDGTLPLEVRRSARAQTYHLFAALPLVLMAELAATNGTDLYSYNNGALHKLVALNVTQFYKPDYLVHRSGSKQVLDRERLPALIAWLEPYVSRFEFTDPKAKKNAERILRTYRPLFDRRAGGDTTLLFGIK